MSAARCRWPTLSWDCGWSVPSAIATLTTTGSRKICSTSPTSSCRSARPAFMATTRRNSPMPPRFFKKFNDDGKTLETEVKKRKDGRRQETRRGCQEGEGGSRQAQHRDRKIRKDKSDAASIAKKQQELEAAKEVIERAEKFRQEMAEMERRSKMMPEIRASNSAGGVPPARRREPMPKSTSTLGTRNRRHSGCWEIPGRSVPAANRDPRELVMAWMRRPDNPYFARAIVNRVWAHYFGRGIVDPPDNLSAFNPPTHPELLEGTRRWLREKPVRSALAAPHDPEQPHLSAVAARRHRRVQPTAPTTPTSRCAACPPRCCSTP